MNVPGWDNKWCGDAWKAIVHLRSQRHDVSAFVLDCDMGLGVVRKTVNSHPLAMTIPQLEKLTFADLQSHLHDWLDLRPAASLTDLHGL